jgi:hypothetical protein
MKEVGCEESHPRFIERMGTSKINLGNSVSQFKQANKVNKFEWTKGEFLTATIFNGE